MIMYGMMWYGVVGTAWYGKVWNGLLYCGLLSLWYFSFTKLTSVPSQYLSPTLVKQATRAPKHIVCGT